MEPLTPHTDQIFNPLLFMYVFALEEVPGNYIKFPKLTWAFCKILAATPNRHKALTLDVGQGPPQRPLLRLPLTVQGLRSDRSL